MTNQEIVAKLWNLCNVLRDDGITYHQYVTELTYILFLKMAKETGTEDKIPEKYRWDRLAEKDGLALKKFYEELLRELGEKGTGRIQEIYSGARSNIEEPANLKKIITNINDLDWYSAKEEGLPREQITIKGTSYSWQVVKSQFLKLKPVHIANLLERLVDNSLEIRNMESYLISTLYSESLSGTLKKQADLHDDYLRYLRGNPYQNIP